MQAIRGRCRDATLATRRPAVHTYIYTRAKKCEYQQPATQEFTAVITTRRRVARNILATTTTPDSLTSVMMRFASSRPAMSSHPMVWPDGTNIIVHNAPTQAVRQKHQETAQSCFIAARQAYSMEENIPFLVTGVPLSRISFSMFSMSCASKPFSFSWSHSSEWYSSPLSSLPPPVSYTHLTLPTIYSV